MKKVARDLAIEMVVKVGVVRAVWEDQSPGDR